jgi:hypothetical protein
LYIVCFLIATFPSAILANGGEEGGVHSFAPPPDPLFPEGPICRSVGDVVHESGPDLPKRGGRTRQSDGSTEFIFLNGSGWTQADQLIKDHTPLKHTSPPRAHANGPKCSG